MHRPFKKLKLPVTAPSERSKVVSNAAGRTPINRQAAMAIFPAPWWSKLNDPEFCGKKIQELEHEIQALKSHNEALIATSKLQERRIEILTKKIKCIEMETESREKIQQLLANEKNHRTEVLELPAIKRLMEHPIHEEPNFKKT